MVYTMSWGNKFRYRHFSLLLQSKLLFGDNIMIRSMLLKMVAALALVFSSAVAFAQSTNPYVTAFQEWVVFFDSGKSAFPAGKEGMVKEIVQAYKTRASTQTIEVLVVGYADTVGNPESNKKLTIARAASVKQAFVAAGIPANRIRVEGMGVDPGYAAQNNLSYESTRRVVVSFVPVGQ